MEGQGLMEIIYALIIGAIAGWLAGTFVKGSGFGLLGDIVIGIVGAIIASFILPRIGFSAGGGVIAQIIHATLGAVVLLLVIRLVKRV